MSATLIGNNVTIKVSAAITGGATSAAGNTTIYTCPANSYALVNISINAVAGSFLSVGGCQVSVTSAAAYLVNVPVGPSQTVVMNTSGSSTTSQVSGVCFINSP